MTIENNGLVSSQTDECRLSGQLYFWQHVSQSLNPKAGMTLVLGENGAGKTFWYNKLQQDLPAVSTIVCQRNLTLMNLIKQFSCLYATSVPIGPHSIQEQVKLVIENFVLPKEQYLLIDDASNLSGEILSFLITLSEYHQQHNLHIILFGSSSLVQKISVANINNAYIHEIVLRPMDIKEIEAFIYTTFHTSEKIDLIMLRRIHQASGGLPKETMNLVRDSWHSLFRPQPFVLSEDVSHLKKDFIPQTSKEKNKKIRLKVLISLLSFAVIISLVFIKYINIEDHKDFMQFFLKKEEIKLENDDSEVVVKPHRPLRPLVDLDHIPIYTIKIEPEVESPPIIADRWIDRDGYVVQLGIAVKSDVVYLEKIQQNFSSNAHIYCVLRNNKPMNLLLLGPFDRKEEAKEVINALPESFVKKQYPWIRTMESVKKEESCEN